jgi:hypothetical protein
VVSFGFASPAFGALLLLTRRLTRIIPSLAPVIKDRTDLMKGRTLVMAVAPDRMMRNIIDCMLDRALGFM